MAKQTVPPLFTLDQCARVTVIDEATGVPVAGAEDLDIDRDAGRIFISAYDRRKAEKIAARRALSVPEGGVYAIDIAALKAGATTFNVRSLLDPAMLEGGLRPHGLSFDRESGVVSFINRGYVSNGDAWRLRTDIVAFDPAQAQSVSASPVECSANDLTSRDGRVLVTLDHSGCGWRAAIEDVFGTRSGRVVDQSGAGVLADLGFANGALITPDGDLLVAATREGAIHVVAFDEENAKITATLNLKAAPDNLTLSDDGRIVAAVHPRLFSIGLQRKLGIGRSPSRVIEIDRLTGDLRLLFDDPKAARVSAATVAVLTNDLLVIGSVIDEGLVVCRSNAVPP